MESNCRTLNRFGDKGRIFGGFSKPIGFTSLFYTRNGIFNNFRCLSPSPLHDIECPAAVINSHFASKPLQLLASYVEIYLLWIVLISVFFLFVFFGKMLTIGNK